MNKDIWLYLVSFLDDMDVIYLRRTCTHLRRIIPQRKIKLLNLMNKMIEGQYLEELTFPILARMANSMFTKVIPLMYYFMTQSNKNTVLVFDRYRGYLLCVIYNELNEEQLLNTDTKRVIMYLNIIKLQFINRCISKNNDMEDICKWLYSDNEDILNLAMEILILMSKTKDIRLEVKRRKYWRRIQELYGWGLTYYWNSTTRLAYELLKLK